MSRYRITILSIQGMFLTFHVDKYEITEGDFISFLDNKTKKSKKFHASRCEIEEIGNGI